MALQFHEQENEFNVRYSNHSNIEPMCQTIGKKRGRQCQNQRQNQNESLYQWQAGGKKCRKQSLLGQPMQIYDFLPGPNGKPVPEAEKSSYLKLAIPQGFDDFILATSSKKESVWLPLWVELDGVRYQKMDAFPNLPNGEEYAAGAQACVAAYERPYLHNDLTGLPLQFALKGVPMFCKRTRQRQVKKGVPAAINPRRKTTWSSEWKMHHFLKQNFDESKNKHKVDLLGGLCSLVNGVYQVFFALELMDTDLFNLIESDSYNGQEVIKLLLSTAQSLRCIHDAGMIYCDLKPENVLVGKTRSEAKFGDFDRSCIPDIKVGVVGGTKGYESPERMVDSMQRSVEDDIWAFGVILLIAGTISGSPFSDCSEEYIKNFRASRYLARHHRRDWTKEQVRIIGSACDRILKFNREERASLDEVIVLLIRAADVPYSKTARDYQDNTVDLTRNSSLIDLTREAPLSDDDHSSISYTASTTSSHPISQSEPVVQIPIVDCTSVNNVQYVQNCPTYARNDYIYHNSWQI
eukprot:CAMPEP_0204823482 /NCGR_PEP_ID=MMETSP1346-20131115/1542_1 /ASSEMBLY_ACC=CAM_ASM_000771 /TAXON_ID=215587 /ORGANISM="Aplanochytrium stocchinoi, Strain GSBS06" /LENGTH=520 /DNA_ID=CAMNT_0051950139 /DNA_START=212 /DNA_END=1774 /DNA_ORIENTATION=-